MSSPTSRPIYLIDTPSPFASADEWRAFIADLEASGDDAPEIKEAIRKAKAHLAELVE